MLLRRYRWRIAFKGRLYLTMALHSARTINKEELIMKFNMIGDHVSNAVMSYKLFTMINAMPAVPAAIGICEAVSSLIR